MRVTWTNQPPSVISPGAVVTSDHGRGVIRAKDGRRVYTSSPCMQRSKALFAGINMGFYGLSSGQRSAWWSASSGANLTTRDGGGWQGTGPGLFYRVNQTRQRAGLGRVVSPGDAASEPAGTFDVVAIAEDASTIRICGKYLNADEPLHVAVHATRPAPGTAPASHVSSCQVGSFSLDEPGAEQDVDESFPVPWNNHANDLLGVLLRTVGETSRTRLFPLERFVDEECPEEVLCPFPDWPPDQIGLADSYFIFWAWGASCDNPFDSGAVEVEYAPENVGFWSAEDIGGSGNYTVGVRRTDDEISECLWTAGVQRRNPAPVGWGYARKVVDSYSPVGEYTCGVPSSFAVAQISILEVV